MILTNKYSVTYDMEAIDRDFDIFIVEKKGKDFNKTNILDLATQQYKARAVQYTSGANAFVLFEKRAVTEKEYQDAITRDYPDVRVRKMDIFDEDECKAFWWQKRLLAQLLMNSIGVPKQMGVAYNNLTGKLLYGKPEWKAVDKKTKKTYMMYFLEIAFDAGMYLNLNVKTFKNECKNRKDSKKGHYIIDPKAGNFRRKLAADQIAEDKVFVEASFAHKRNTVKYLDFKTFNRFKKCKLGVLEQFTQDVEKYLGEYMILTPGQRNGDMEFAESQKERENLSVSDYSSILSERDVNIVDECRDKVSGAIVSRLINELFIFYGITAKVGTLERGMYNIRIIHNEEYYKEKELPDPHEENLHGYIVQHVTEEDCSDLSKEVEKKESPIIHKIIIELILKGDVRTGKISIYNWAGLSNGKEWTFVTREKFTGVKVSEGGVTNSAGNRTFNYYRYACLCIRQDGKLCFTTFNDVKIADTEYEEKIRSAYDKYFDTQKIKHKKYVEGLVFSDIQNIHAIIRTNEKTMPNTRNLWIGLKGTNDKDAVITDLVLDVLDKFVENYPEDREYIEGLRESIINFQLPMTKKKMRRLMNMKKGAAKRLNRFMHEYYGIWISAEIKDRDFEKDYQIENILNIKYFEESNTDGTGKASFNYYVGPTRSNLQSSIHNACVIRQVQAQGEIEFAELLPLMAVDFVRIGMYTVLPFPFKYLREYLKMV